ncbi:FitA-like ribbon-helix-helix domain-containing protein [Sphingomonas adhaesiva]|uniref:FitA-like ribbon-helix-helix domain-containing protein n=1 Tax=Sphingomonas adhaesiva TaxID=28212 RepID=UPI002FF770D7
MGSVTIRNLDDAVKQSARLEAARNGRSLEAELRALLERSYPPAANDRAAQVRAMSSDAFVDHLIRTANGATLDVIDRPHDDEAEVFGAG